jgi:hypothetical protein
MKNVFLCTKDKKKFLRQFFFDYLDENLKQDLTWLKIY